MPDDYAPNENRIGGEGSAAEYSGPLRRSSDLTRETERKDRTIRIRTINVAVITVAFVISLVLLGAIKKKQALVEALLGDSAAESTALLHQLMRRQEWLAGLLLLVVVAASVVVILLILKPIEEYISRIREHRMLPLKGAYELRYLARAYNVMYEENLRHNEELRYKAEHDHLTGLYNRGAFEKLREAHQNDDIALLLIDVDKFKDINDAYGHDTGDKVLQKVAALLDADFRSTDYPCRIGGDEFAVIMADMTLELRQAVLDKLESVKNGLRDTSDGLPEATLSVGVAFSGQRKEGDDLFKMADRALYRVKEGGRNGCAFYGDAEKRGKPVIQIIGGK